MTKKPIPVWLKISAGVIAILLTACIVILPQVVQAAFEYRRGMKAQNEGRYWTAIREYEQAMGRFPDSASIIARLAVSYFYIEKMDSCSELLQRIEGKRLKGRLAEQVNHIAEKLDSSYHESEELLAILRYYGGEELEKTAARLEAYLESNGKDVMGFFHLANMALDIEDYASAEELYKKVLTLEPEFYTAKLNLAAVYRITGSFEKAEECCMQVLEANKEHPQAFVALSKLELARGNYQQGLEYAQKACEYGGEDIQAAANLCIAYNYNGMTAERDKLFLTLQQKGYYDLTAIEAMLGINK